MAKNLEELQRVHQTKVVAIELTGDHPALIDP
jgi:hypothetical protein